MNCKIIEALDSIDWNAVHELYATNRWKWYYRPSIIPSAKELREKAESVVETAFDRRGWQDVMCGRIYSKVSNGVLEIYFGSSRNKKLRHLFDLFGSGNIKGIDMKTQEYTYEEKLAKIRQLGGDVHYSGDVDSERKDFWCDCGELYDNHLLVEIIERGKSVEEAVNNCWAELENVKPGQCIYGNGRYVILYKGEWVDIDKVAMNKRNK